MNSFTITPNMITSDRKGYAVWRMHLAAERLLRAESVAEEIQAGYWVLAWAVMAGARLSARDMHTAVATMNSMTELRLH